MLPHALSATLALALAIPGGVFAVDAVNDDAVPGLDAGSYLRGHAPGFGAHGHDGHDKGHAHAHPGAHDRAHEKASDRDHSGHDAKEGHAFHDHRGANGVQMVARCLASDNRSDEECIQLADRIANDTVTAVAACMESDETDCRGHDHKHAHDAHHASNGHQAHHGDDANHDRGAHHDHHARIAQCIEEQGTEPCVEILATHLVCQGAHMAGVESPIACPERHHDKHEASTGSDDDSDDADQDAQTSSDGA